MAWACSVDSHRVKCTKHARCKYPSSVVRDPYGAHSPLQSGELPSVLSIVVVARLAALRAGGERIGFEHDGRPPPLPPSLLPPSFVALCGIAHSQKLFSSFNTLSIIYVAPPSSVSRASASRARERAARRRRKGGRGSAACGRPVKRRCCSE